MNTREKIYELGNQIIESKRLLQSTDYKAIKYAEGEISAEEYAETKAQRRLLRAQINQLEAEIAELKFAN